MADTFKKAMAEAGSVYDRALATFAAGAVGFATFLMPAHFVTGIAVLGTHAGRVALSIVAALATFLGVSLILAALSHSRRGHAEGPRLRRADMHPDAPARVPILAGRELGVPLDEVALDARTAEVIDLGGVETVDYEAEWERPLPGFIEAAVEKADEGEPEPELSSGLPFWVPDESVSLTEDGGIGPPEPERQVAVFEESSVVPFWLEPSAENPPGDNELLLDRQEPPIRLVAVDPTPDEPAEPPENGVLRRKPAKRGGPQAPSPHHEDAQLEERLRGAISNLRRMARG